ncbi:MAG: PAS domain S-box protein [Bacteroidales bacterium]|nr:PAS domain S-box protein [Bacteroidales bacterium]
MKQKKPVEYLKQIIARDYQGDYISKKELNKLLTDIDNEFYAEEQDVSAYNSDSSAAKANSLEFLAQSAIELVEFKSIEDIYKYTADKLYDLLDKKAIITVVDYHLEKNYWQMKQVRGIEKLNNFSSRFGFDLTNMTGQTETPFLNKLKKGQLTELDFDVPALTNGKVSKYIGTQFKKLFSLDKLFCIPFKKNTNILGNISIFPKKGYENFNASLIEAFVGQVSNFVEILNQKRNLQEEEEKYRTIFETSPDPICITDGNNNIVKINPMFLSLSGYSEEQLVGQHLNELNIFQLDNDPENLLQANVVNYETQLRTISGQVKDILLSTQKITIEQQPHILSFIKDITSIREHERKILKLENRYKTIVTHQPGGAIFLFDTDKNFMTAAGKALELLNIDENSEEKITLKNTFPSELQNTISTICEEILQGNKVVRTIEYKQTYFSVWGVPVKDQNNKIREGLIYFVNISPLKEKEHQLKQALEKAEESDRLKSVFLTNISHEVRTPMNGIIGFTEMLKTNTLTDEEYYEYLDIIEKSSARLMKLVNNLVDISLIQAKEVQLKTMEFNLNEKLKDLFNQYSSDIDKNAVTLNLNTPLEDSESCIASDPTLLEKILINLLDNAVKYTNKGKITYGYTIKDDTLEFFVSDTGIGINQETKDIIFDYFRQEDSSFNRQYEGAGLGLSISSGYVKMLNGDIWVESAPKKGSTFYFTIEYKKCKNQTS